MDPTRPTVRYYDARRTRPWHFVVLGIVLVAGTIGAWFGTDLLRAEAPSRNGVVTIDGQLGSLESDDDANSGITIAPPSSDRSDATAMAMVGDSITEGSTDEIRYTLAAEGFVDMDIDGLTSRRIEEGDGSGSPLSGIRTLEGMLADEQIDPDVWVVALGTNDIGQYDDPDDYRRLIRTVLEMIPDDIPLVWVDGFRADKPEASAEFDEILVEEVSTRRDSVVASWHDQASRDAETEVLQDDGVHPNQHGRVVFAALVAEAIAAVT
jgi:lysophospholipase L1-like esterase